MEKLPKSIHRFLISTTTRLTGEFDSPDIRIDHAWRAFGSYHRVREGLEEGPLSRNYFVLSVNIAEPEKRTIIIPNYTGVGDNACAFLSILYGKRFDNHGFLITHGMFNVPELHAGPPTNFFQAAPYNHRPRPDVGIPLELGQFSLISRLFTEDHPDEKFVHHLLTAARFYSRALRIFDQEPEFAYMDLVTCGEVLSGYYEYPIETLLDAQTIEDFARIRTDVPDGEKIARRLQKNQRQIKRAYTRTLLSLLTDRFFTSAPDTFGAGLQKADIEKRLKAAYDLRSLYVHTGINFGHLTQVGAQRNEEVQLGRPIVGNRDFEKAIAVAPTFLGMERIIRFCLLRFIHRHGMPIGEALEGSLSGSLPGVQNESPEQETGEQETGTRLI